MGVTAAGTGAASWQSASGSYNDRWTGLTLQSSYSFSRSDAEDERSSRRSYFQQGSSPGHYMQDQTSQAVTRSHTLNLRADISLDSSNSLLANGSEKVFLLKTSWAGWVVGEWNGCELG